MQLASKNNVTFGKIENLIKISQEFIGEAIDSSRIDKTNNSSEFSVLQKFSKTPEEIAQDLSKGEYNPNRGKDWVNNRINQIKQGNDLSTAMWKMKTKQDLLDYAAKNNIPLKNPMIEEALRKANQVESDSKLTDAQFITEKFGKEFTHLKITREQTLSTTMVMFENMKDYMASGAPKDSGGYNNSSASIIVFPKQSRDYAGTHEQSHGFTGTLQQNTKQNTYKTFTGNDDQRKIEIDLLKNNKMVISRLNSLNYDILENHAKNEVIGYLYSHTLERTKEILKKESYKGEYFNDATLRYIISTRMVELWNENKGIVDEVQNEREKERLILEFEKKKAEYDIMVNFMVNQIPSMQVSITALFPGATKDERNNILASFLNSADPQDFGRLATLLAEVAQQKTGLSESQIKQMVDKQAKTAPALS